MNLPWLCRASLGEIRMPASLHPLLTTPRRAADFLNTNHVDLVSLQHEYGIFGGKAGSYILEILRERG